MKHRLSTNWMLLAGVLLLGGFIFLFERGRENSEQRQQRTRTVFEVEPETVERMVLERDGRLIECTKSSGIWRLTQPADAPVDSGLVEQMIASMARVERGERIPVETLQARNLTPADYGFDSPRARITFKSHRGLFTWLIGRDAPVGETLYVMPEGGGDILAAPRALLQLIPQDSSWIRDRTLFSGEPAAVRGLDLRRTAGFLQLRQSAHTGWVIQQPHAGRADRQALHAWMDKIFSPHILDFITDQKADLTAYGLETPTYELTIFMQDEQTQTLLLGSPLKENPEALYAKRVESDSVFTVPSGWVNELEIHDNRLRSRWVVAVQPDRVSAIELIRNEQRLTLLRTNDLWRIERPVRWEADPAKIAELLRALAEAVVEDFVDQPSAAQTAQIKAAPWTIELTADGQTNTLHITPPGTNELRMVQYNDEPTFYMTHSNLVHDTFADPLFYRSRAILAIPPAQIQKIIRQSDGTEQSVQKTADGTFAADPPSRPLRANELTDLLRILSNLQAERYVEFNPVSLSPYELDPPQTVLTVTLSDTNVVGHRVLLGGKTRDGRFAMLQGQGLVFILSEKTAQPLSLDLTVPLENPAEETQQP